MKTPENNNDKKTAPGRHPRILISGGGTGGHIFPALAIADAIRRLRPDAEILFVGAEGRMEMERVPAAGYPIKGLPVAGFDRKHLLRNIKVVWKLLVSLCRARRILKEFKPDIAIGVGGYASGPMLKAAQRRHIPTLIQEQNSYAGVTNKLLGGKASAICVAYDNMERFFPADRIIQTGNPVRENLTRDLPHKNDARRALGFDPEKPLLVVTGGSLGARTVNRSMADAFRSLLDRDINILWQTGNLYFDEYAPLAEGIDPSRLQIVRFITDMPSAYAAATLVVSRAGASTISELQLLGMPALLIPSPNVAEDHQRKNAMALVERHAAAMLSDDDAPAMLGETVGHLITHPRELDLFSRNVRQMARHDSARVIALKALELAGFPPVENPRTTKK
ncbi:MAG: undecaprenyldiphospho-muramoylpentapeptide beta-N-acetylglucosaminyltransferase [Clostridium sp.]|nr:undecaprenyldiphospho-muramoylpentapeptide beta-N-acetylglucosaminyltransferase [Clostridium sp.]